MSAGAGVFDVNVGDGEEVLGGQADHAFGDARTELQDLPTDVSEEGVGGPTPDEHDGEDRDPGEVHRHGRSRADGVCADVGVGETEDVLADALGGRLEHRSEVGRGDELAFVARDDGADETLLVASRVGQDPLDDEGPRPDGAEDVEEGSMLVDRLVADVRLLVLEGDGDGRRRGQAGVAETHDAIPFEETDVPEAERLRSSRSRDVHVLARAHGEEEGTDGKLGRRLFGGGRRALLCRSVHVLEDGRRHGLLLLHVFVEVAVAALLAL